MSFLPTTVGPTKAAPTATGPTVIWEISFSLMKTPGEINASAILMFYYLIINIKEY
jgi:hypothetical protein